MRSIKPSTSATRIKRLSRSAALVFGWMILVPPEAANAARKIVDLQVSVPNGQGICPGKTMAALRRVAMAATGGAVATAVTVAREARSRSWLNHRPVR